MWADISTPIICGTIITIFFIIWTFTLSMNRGQRKLYNDGRCPKCGHTWTIGNVAMGEEVWLQCPTGCGTDFYLPASTKCIKGHKNIRNESFLDIPVKYLDKD